MPQATDITINNGAATPVAKTFSLYSPAAGDGSWAQWRLKEGTIASVFPRIAALARQTPNKARTVQTKLQIPSSYTDAVTGLTKVGSTFDAEVRVTVPDDFPENLKNDASAFLSNLVNHALIKAMNRDALPAT